MDLFVGALSQACVHVRPVHTHTLYIKMQEKSSLMLQYITSADMCTVKELMELLLTC